jgi:Na+-translocating ferredoxin:NAD+ oxidoreductase subunit G
VKEMLRYGFVLGLICIVASASLTAVNSITQSRIIAQVKAEEEASLKEVMPEAVNFEPVNSKEGIIYYKAFNKYGKFIGVAFKVSGKGYSSAIGTMVGMAHTGEITAIKVLSQNETPGLGAQVAGTLFTSRFSNRNIQDLDGVQAITGATISSRAVIDSVSKKAQEIKELIKNER